MRLTVIPPLAPALSLARACAIGRGIICYPTDTLYGLGGDATDADVVRRIFELKGRGERRPVSVIFADWGMARPYVKASSGLVARLSALTPGPFTFLLPLRNPMPVTSGPLLGCRLPDHEFCLQLGRQLGRPLISTSANPAGERAASCVEELDERIASGVDLIVDGGPTKYAQGSTVIDVGAQKIARAGAQADRAKMWLESL